MALHSETLLANDSSGGNEGAAQRGRPQGIAPTMDERAGAVLRSMVGAIPCGRPAGAKAAALHSYCHSPTKS